MNKANTQQHTLKNSPAFPTHQELLRSIAVVLDSKQLASRDIDNLVRGGQALSVSELKATLKEVLYEAIVKHHSPLAATIVYNVVLEYCRDYSELVATTNADTLTRSALVDRLATEVLPEFWNELFIQLHIFFKIPGSLFMEMIQPDVSAIQAANRWVRSEFPDGPGDWDKHCKAVFSVDGDKSPIYKFFLNDYARHNEQNLPKLSTIARLFFKQRKPEYERLWIALSVARVIDYAKRDQGAAALALSSAFSGGRNSEFFPSFQRRIAEDRMANIGRAELDRIYTQLDDVLSLRTNRTLNDRKMSVELLGAAEAAYSKGFTQELSIVDRSHYYRARFNVMCGDLGIAVKNYGKALDAALYVDGGLTRKVIQEGYVVAARHSAKGTDVLLRKLRKAANILLLDGVGALDNTKMAGRADTYIADWEKQHWQMEFQSIFPPECMFPGSSIPALEANPWFLQQSVSAGDDKIPTRSPNAPIKQGNVIEKKVTKLAESIRNGDKEAFDKLLEKGADINLQDSSGSTALIAALDCLNPIKKLSPVHGRYFWEELARREHTRDALNSLCMFTGYTALRCAISTGQAGIVKEVIELYKRGSDPDNSTDDDVNHFVNQPFQMVLEEQIVTPLYYVLGMIGGVKNKTKLPAYRQHTFTFNLEELRKMALLLIEYGAKALDAPIDDSQTSPYWLSITLDESEILQALITAGANSTAVLVDMNSASQKTAIEMAEASQAKKCLVVLKNAPAEKSAIH